MPICAPPGELALKASHSIGGDSCFEERHAKEAEATAFSVMSLCAWLLRQVRPESRWRERVKTLLDDYSDVSLSAMGFPDDWREYALWK